MAVEQQHTAAVRTRQHTTTQRSLRSLTRRAHDRRTLFTNTMLTEESRLNAMYVTAFESRLLILVRACGQRSRSPGFFNLNFSFIFQFKFYFLLFFNDVKRN